MANETRRIGLFGVTGILIAVVIIAGFVIANNVFQVSGKGTLTIRVMDKPVELKNLNVTIDWARIQDQNGNWINLMLRTEPFYFDLLSLQNVSETLSETAIPAGNYTMISMHVLTANATYLDDSTVDLNVPSAVIKVLLKPQLNLEDGGQVTVLIDLQPDDLNSIAISHSLNLRPVIKAVVPYSDQ
ncbi:MAG: DUF4382 domain-containing protein [Candidatus Bathyarchaeota archaeon]|nr:DUF4382 domain-containing protein [Candidatus Bathyarchaeota archaeon]